MWLNRKFGFIDIKMKFTDCIDITGRSCKKFGGKKIYISTGAVDVDHVDSHQIEMVNYDTKPSRANLITDDKSILFAKMQGTKKVLLINKELENNLYSTGFFSVSPKKNMLNKKCLYHLLGSKTFLSQKDKYCSGATQKAISLEGLNKIEITIPNLEEQNQIAKTLDSINVIIKSYEKELKRYDELIKARFVEMFGNPICNQKEWSVKKLSQCLTSIDNGKSFVCATNSRVNNKSALLKLSAVTYGYYNPEENKEIIDVNQFVANAEVHSGDLLFTRKNTPELVGMSAYVYDTPTNLMMPDLIFRLNVSKCCNKIFLWKLINHDLFRPCIENIATGSAKSMSNISKERLLGLKIIVPPMDLQLQFADFVKQVDKSKYDDMYIRD